MRRVISLWLPEFAAERWHRQRQPLPARSTDRPPAKPVPRIRPLALVAREGGRLILAAVDGAAAAAGLTPGMPLAGAHALAPDLWTAPHDPRGDAAALGRLAAWCERYTPWTAPGGSEPGGAAGILLDVTGCAHLFGGERALAADLEARVGALGFTARTGLAETIGAAWALARFGGTGVGPAVAPPARVRAALAPLPPVALRLPAETCELLARLGLRRIGALYDLPPETLAPRFGPMLARRLRQALGEEAEPLSPGAPPPPPLVRRVFAEPISAPEDLARGLEALSPALCRRLETGGLGARRLELTAYRVDNSLQHMTLGTSRPCRDPAHLIRMFGDKLDGLDPGFGIEVLTLAAPVTEPLAHRQLALEDGCGGAAEGLSALVDRLEGRLGPNRTFALAPRESHLPERAVARRPALAASGAGAAWRRAQPRPLRLFAPPEPVEALALLPDHPPVRFSWRRLQHRVVRAAGPERLTDEWWRVAGASPEISPATGARDYFRVEDADGRRYWLYRSDGRWFLHGLFA
jgi:protein ImuB